MATLRLIVESENSDDIRRIAIMSEAITDGNVTTIGLANAVWHLLDEIHDGWIHDADEVMVCSDSDEWVGLAKRARMLADLIESELRQKYHSEIKLVEDVPGQLTIMTVPIDWDEVFRLSVTSAVRAGG